MLDGIRILDLSRYLPGPACTWQLAAWGAGVDRVEPARQGDAARHLPPLVDGVGALFASINNGKRSLAIDFRHPDASVVLRRLASHYDVWVEGFRPGVLEAMGLDPERLLTENPRLILARISAHGQSGTWRDMPGHDLNFVGLAGITGMTADPPTALPVQVADWSGAYVAATAICAALFARERTGRGRVLDIALAETALAFVAPQVLAASVEGREPRPNGELLTGGWSAYGVYRCADGGYVTVGAVEPKFQAALAALTGGGLSREDLERLFLTRPRDAWADVFAPGCVAPVLGLQEVGGHAPFVERGAVEQAGASTWVRPPLASVGGGSVPGLGEHTDAILSDAGVSAGEIAAWRQSAVVG